MNCRRCNYNIGNNIRFCPKCGLENSIGKSYIKPKLNNNLLKIIGAILSIVIVIIGLVFLNKDNIIIDAKKVESVPLPFDENGKWGYMDENGNELIAAKYDWANEFNEGRAVVMVDEKYGLIDESGNIIIPIEYEELGNLDIFENTSEVRNGLIGGYKYGKYYMIDKDGNLITEDYNDPSFLSFELLVGEQADISQFSQYAYDKYNSLSEGLSIYMNKDTEKYGYVDEEGSVVIEAQFDSAFEFSEGLAAVINDGKLGFINKKGKIVIDCIYDIGDGEYRFSDGLCAVKKNEKYGYINKKGKFIIEPIYYKAFNFKDGLACVINEESDMDVYGDDIYGEYIVSGFEVDYIDKKGNIKIENIKQAIYNDYSSNENFSGELTTSYKDNKVGYINKNGETTIDYMFDWATEFKGNVARVNTDDEAFWINKDGKAIVPYKGLMSVSEYIEYKSSLDKDESYDSSDSSIDDYEPETIYDVETLIKSRVKKYEKDYVEAVNNGNFYILEPNLLDNGSMYDQFRDIVQDYYGRNLKLITYDHNVDNIIDLGDGEYKVNVYEKFGVIKDGVETIKEFDSIYTVKIEDGVCYMKDILL